MARIIEVTVAPDGATTVQTRGYAGADSQSASRFLEQALGIAHVEHKTAEFYQALPANQSVQH